MSSKTHPYQSALFSRGGRAGRAPGRGYRNLAGTTPTSMSSRPSMGLGMAKFRKHPPKGQRP